MGHKEQPDQYQSFIQSIIKSSIQSVIFTSQSSIQSIIVSQPSMQLIIVSQSPMQSIIVNQSSIQSIIKHTAGSVQARLMIVKPNYQILLFFINDGFSQKNF